MSDAPKLPTTWLETKLGEVVEYGRFSKAEPNEIRADEWVLELEDIEKDTSKILARITYGERKSKSTKNRFTAGDVLYGKLRPYLNKVVRADRSGVCTTEIVPIQPNAAVDGGYLFHWLRHPRFLGYVTSVSHGLNMPRLGTEAGRNAPFVLAPVAEQRRIAAKLDAVLAKFDAGRERLDRVPLILKRFREAVLEAAVSGRLTEEVIERVRLETVADVIDPHPSHRTPPEFAGGVPYIGIGDIDASGRVDFVNARRVNPKLLDEHKERYSLRAGDFVFGKIGTLGRATPMPLPQDYTISANVLLVQPQKERIESKFLRIVMSSPSVLQGILDSSSATSQAAFGIKKMRSLVIPLPPTSRQLEIVRRVDELFAYADSIERKYETALSRVEKLTPSVLVRAFCGELVPQDPKDEPASELLKRIQAEREAAAPARLKATNSEAFIRTKAKGGRRSGAS